MPPEDDEAKPASPYHEILAWSESLHPWQRDALRRIIGGGRLSTADLDELELICLARHNIAPSDGHVPEVKGLEEAHLPAAIGTAAPVTLAGMNDLANVNRLAPDQVLDFGPPVGLTIIYGENGSGKSGYARVIKKACRARGSAPDIKLNALDTNVVGPARATLRFRVGAQDIEVPWRDGLPCDPRLASVFVFDAASAASHVGADEPTCFTPQGLDVLPKLAAACDQLKKRFMARADSEFADVKKKRAGWKARGHTTVGKLLVGLNERTEAAEVDVLAAFTEVEQRRLSHVWEALKSDPKRKAQETRAAAARVRAFARLVTSADATLGDRQLQVFRDTIRSRDEAIAAEAATAGPAFDATFLAGTGGDAWRRLWSMAEAYSTSAAYRGHEFPHLADDAKCVLCQQKLDEDAGQRFQSFRSYIRADARREADVARKKVADFRATLELRVALAEEYAKVEADLAGEPEATREAVKAFVSAADERLMGAREALAAAPWADPPLLPASPASDLETIAIRLDERSAMELSADDPEKRKQLVAEKEELEDREWLFRSKDDVLSAVESYRRAAAFKSAQDDTATILITKKSCDLDTSVVTNAFCKAFHVEVEALGLRTLPVAMKPLAGVKGTRPFGVRLAGGVGPRIVGIASEGEERCVSLAAFLAELSQASHRSALVFDDPVSSLDYRRREAIAVRLVEEAKVRQVVVFTHSLAFICDLQNAAEEAGVAIHGQYLAWSATAPGKCHASLPWEAQTHKAQMKTLRERIGKAQKVLETDGEAEYRPLARELCSEIRAAAERIVEEVLVNRVLVRHDSRIQIGRLQSLGVVKSEDYKLLHAIWKHCSDLTNAHAASASRPVTMPGPDKLLEMVTDLEALALDVNKRRQAKVVIPETTAKLNAATLSPASVDASTTTGAVGSA